MSVLRFSHPRKLTEREIAQHVERIIAALRGMVPPLLEK